jgi:hypothetical protein
MQHRAWVFRRKNNFLASSGIRTLHRPSRSLANILTKVSRLPTVNSINQNNVKKILKLPIVLLRILYISMLQPSQLLLYQTLQLKLKYQKYNKP